MNYLKKKEFVEFRRQTAAQYKILRELEIHNIEIEHLMKGILAHQEYSNSKQSQIDAQKSYNSVVLAIGYAGFFAIWAFLKDIMPDHTTSLTAILVGMSLIFYVLWEVFLASISSFEIVSKHDKNEAEANNKPIHHALFPYVWLATIVPALAGCFLLFYNAVAHFLGLPMWPNPC